MSEIEVVITDEYGIHARPAAILVQKAQELPCEILIVKGRKKADAKKLLAVMKLTALQGDTLLIKTSGEDEAAGLEAIVATLKEVGLT